MMKLKDPLKKMRFSSIRDQFKENWLALISLLIAVIALLHSTWRSDETERNFNMRIASFEVLKNLGELQVIVNYAYYQPKESAGNPLMGWGRIALIGDLSQLLPDPVPEKASKLIDTWKQNWSTVSTNENSADLISDDITATRLAVLNLIKGLH